jgi:putative acetyltransferase
MHIRDERPGNEQDSRAILHIEYTAFKGHPMHAPGAEPTEHLIVERLRASGDLTLSLLAEVDGEPVGHVTLSPAVVGADRSGWYLLGPVGVLPPMQGRGIGSALIRDVLRRMREAGALGVVLVGDPGYYVRFGFARVPDLGYPGVPGQYVLAVRFGDRLPQGDIIAHAAFAE